MAHLTLNTGMKLLVAKQYQEVYDLAITALRQNEKNPLAFFFLGLVATDTGHPNKALEFFNKACEHGPNTARFHGFYAKALLDHGQKSEAKARADIAQKLSVDDAFLADMIGVVYSRTGYHDRAIIWFERAVSLNPNWANFHFNLGASAQFIGDFSKAKTTFSDTLKIDQKFYPAWFALIGLTPQSKTDNHIDTLTQVFDQASGDPEGLFLIGHTLAKTFEDMGEFETSLDWLQKAKTAKSAHIHYDKNEIERMFSAAKVYQSNSGQGHIDEADPTPIFIVGMPRTGTTLLDRILSSHPDVSSCGELHLIDALVRTQIQSGTPHQITADRIRAAQTLNSLTLGRNFLRQAYDCAKPNRYMIDKTPLNFLYLGLIHNALPNARILCVRRNPIDSCLSNYRHAFAAHMRDYEYSFSLRNTAHYYREFDALMTHWRAHLPANRFMEIHYEDIVLEQEAQTRNVLEFCDLDWDERCLRFHENSDAVDTASAVQVRDPLNTDSLNRWKQYGDKLSELATELSDLYTE